MCVQSLDCPISVRRVQDSVKAGARTEQRRNAALPRYDVETIYPRRIEHAGSAPAAPQPHQHLERIVI